MKLVTSNRAKEQARANLFMMGIASLITIVIWVGLSVYFSYTKSSVKSDIKALITPINPSLDSEILEQYQSTRIVLPDTFLITTVSKEGSKVNRVVIDPFNNTRSTSEPGTASGSAVISNEP